MDCHNSILYTVKPFLTSDKIEQFSIMPILKNVQFLSNIVEYPVYEHENNIPKKLNCQKVMCIVSYG